MFLSRILIQRYTGRYRYVLDRKCAMHLFDHSIIVDVLCRLNCSVGISGSPHLPPRNRLWLPPGSKWGGGTHSLAGEIVGVRYPIPTKGQKLWYLLNVYYNLSTAVRYPVLKLLSYAASDGSGRYWGRPRKTARV
jgi:hypothetical protein